MKQKITKPEQKSENNKKQNNPSNEAKMKQTRELSNKLETRSGVGSKTDSTPFF